jgi:hypothetical protein
MCGHDECAQFDPVGGTCLTDIYGPLDVNKPNPDKIPISQNESAQWRGFLHALSNGFLWVGSNYETETELQTRLTKFQIGLV